MVSVVIPVYNRAGMIAEAVRSCLDQERVTEVIVVDDGSTDGSGQVVTDVFGDESRVRYVLISHSGYPGFVRNRGAELAEGQYLAFLDSDDIWLPGKIATQLAIHRAGEEPRISHTRERWVRSGKTISQSSQRHRRTGDVFGDALQKCILGPSTVLMERSLFVETGGFREDLEIAEDYEYWLRITDRHRVGYIPDECTVKRAGHGDQLSEKYGHIEYFRIKALRGIVDGNVLEPAHRDSARSELARKCRIYAAGAEKRGKVDEANHFRELAERYQVD